jgi:hypothetical protein
MLMTITSSSKQSVQKIYRTKEEKVTYSRSSNNDDIYEVYRSHNVS